MSVDISGDYDVKTTHAGNVISPPAEQGLFMCVKHCRWGGGGHYQELAVAQSLGGEVAQASNAT